MSKVENELLEEIVNLVSDVAHSLRLDKIDRAALQAELLKQVVDVYKLHHNMDIKREIK